MQILLVQHLYFWIYGLVWADIRHKLFAEKAEKFVETSGWNKIYCWLCKCAQIYCWLCKCAQIYRWLCKCAQTKFIADCTNVHKWCPIYFIVIFWIIKECFLGLKFSAFFFFVNPGGFFLGVQSNELASNVHKPKKLYWYIFCTSAEHQQRRGPGRVPVPRNQGIYVVNELNIATTVDFSVFTFFLMILYLCVWLIFPSLLQWIESNTFLTKLVFLVFVLILCIIEIHDADSWLHK